MTMPSPFEVSRHIGNNLAGAFAKVHDENAIESILSKATQSGDPKVLQDSIGQILSQVSPERQGIAIKYLENSYQRVLEKQQLERQQAASRRHGVDADLPQGLQTEQFKQNAKQKRIDSAYGPSQAQPNPTPAQPMMNQPAPNQTPSITPKGIQSKTDDELVNLSGHPDKEVSKPAEQELKRRQEERKEDRADIRDLKKERSPFINEIINRANASRESIRSKTHLLDIIDRNQLNDPTYAIFAESLPFNLGKRLLSDDTVEYKGGLVDEFSDLKNIFKGATRVKEVEIYENKLADLYLNDSQKKAILKSRINAAKVDIIREEAAAEIDEKYPNIKALQFNKKVDELAQPKIDKLFNSIWEEHKSILDQAERKKEIPLDSNDPEDYKIMTQILIESGNNTQKAFENAKKKGYSFK